MTTTSAVCSPSSGGSTAGLPASAIQKPCASCSMSGSDALQPVRRDRGGHRLALDLAQAAGDVGADRVDGEVGLQAGESLEDRQVAEREVHERVAALEGHDEPAVADLRRERHDLVRERPEALD